MNTSYSITSKYQVTIPKEAREKLGLKANDRVSFETQKGRLIIKRAPTMKEVADILSADLKKRGVKPATDKEIKNARDTFYKKGMKWG